MIFIRRYSMNPVFVVEGYRGGQAPNTTTELGVIASVAAVDTLA